MPHFIKILINQYPNCTIEPHAGIVEVPDPRRPVGKERSKRTAPSAMRLQFFVLV
jgi:ribosome-binding ATPase YchF (GTP1/OBG family)